MTNPGHPSVILLGVSPGTPIRGLARLLARQRAEEPDTPVLVQEAPQRILFQGLIRGAFHVGLTDATMLPAGLSSLPLLQEDLVVALPRRSPLLAYASVPASAIRDYPLIQWCPDTHEFLYQHVSALLGEHGSVSRTVKSSALMACLVGAGYGIGVAPRTSIERPREWGILMRPLQEGTSSLRTSLCWQKELQSGSVERFIQRACSAFPPLRQPHQPRHLDSPKF